MILDGDEFTKISIDNKKSDQKIINKEEKQKQNNQKIKKNEKERGKIV